MKTKIAVLCMAFVLLGCHSFHSPSFELTSQRLKVQFDPVQQKLAVTDTIAITFYKNVDAVYFLLQDTMQVERVCIGNQDLLFEQLTEYDFRDYNPCAEQSEFVDKNLVHVRIPKSLYPERIEVWYSGEYPKSTQENAACFWHPVQPGVPSTFSVTALCPKNYQCEFNGEQLFLAENDMWCLSRWQQNNPVHNFNFTICSL